MDGFDGLDALVGDMRDAENTESATESLTRFVQACEEALLALDSALPSISLPQDIDDALDNECRSLLALLASARAGDVSAILSCQLMEPLATTLLREQVHSALETGGVPQLLSELRVACSTFVDAAPEGAIATRRLALLLLAVVSLQAYARANWTGPTAADFGGPFDISADADSAPHGRAFLDALEIDGEPAYELVVGVGYLWLACALLGVLPSDDNATEMEPQLAGGCTLVFWRGRCGFMWQLSLAEASERGLGQSPWLFKLSVHDLVGSSECNGPMVGTGFLESKEVDAVRAITAPVLNTWRDSAGRLRAPPGPPTTITNGSQDEPVSSSRAAEVTMYNGEFCKEASVRTSLLVEFCLRLCWYGRTKDWESMLQAACAPINLNFEITGVLGIKRKYQQEEFAQMAVKTSSSLTNSGYVASQTDRPDGDVSTPANLKLLEMDDMTDVLEGTRISKTVDEDDRAKLEKPLTAAEQLVLLTKCHYVWATSNPNDEMTLEIINALAQRVLCTFDKEEDCGEADGLMKTSNWLAFSCGLFYRCRAEHHRNKTRERAAYQLQALVDQFNDEKPSAAHRVLVVHGAGYPARFHLQREMGMRMMRMGMVSTAFEQFKKLRMWPDAIDCLMVAERKAECLDMVRDLLEKAPTPRLWCALGDIETEHALEYYDKAWELSGHRYARAQRSLGRHHFTKGNLEKAIECFQTAVQINPLHSSVWFTCGVAQMRLERYDDAAQTFSRCIGVEDENSEAWANLAAVHSQRNDLKQARLCMFEATRRARENWRMWESFLGVNMRLRDIQGCIQCMRRLVELEQASRIDERLLGMITSAVVSDAEGLYEGATGSKFAVKTLDFFKFITSKCASEPCYWRCLAELQLFHGKAGEALDSRIRQCRAEQAKLWVEADPEKFGKALSSLIECFESVAEAMEDVEIAEQARMQLQPFAYSVRNAEKQLHAKIEACLQVPEAWASAHEKVSTLAAQAESKATAAAATLGTMAAGAA